MPAIKVIEADLVGDEARIHWLGIIFDELAGEVERSYATGRLTQDRFEYVLKKTTSLIGAAYTAGGSKIYSVEN